MTIEVSVKKDWNDFAHLIMNFKFKRKLKHRAVIDITSLIDLVFLLVAFFMVTSSLESESSITVHLPKAVQTGVYKKKNNITISINKDNEVFVNDVKYKKETLLTYFKKIKKTSKDVFVVIRGDRKANYEVIVNIMDYLNQAGIPKFTLSTIK